MDKASFFDTLNKYANDSFCNTDDEPSSEDLRLAELFSANRARRSISNTLQRGTTLSSTTSSTTTTSTNITNIDINTTNINTETTTTTNTKNPKMPKRKTQETTNAQDTTRKKRSKPTPQKPQIFTAQTFYFIKPSLKRPERKMRIEKAQEYGATVVFTFSELVTHIIADSDVKYNEILEFLGLREVPGSIAVVNPRWAGDCIRYGRLVDPSEFWYRVPGSPSESQLLNDTTLPSTTTSAVEVEEESLQVQPRPATKEKQETPPPSQKDALDEAIEECLATHPINISDFLHSSSPESSDTESPPSPKKQPKTTQTSVKKDWQSHFQCMHPHTGQLSPTNPNTRTISILTEMLQVYTSLQDQWRTRSYRLAISTLKSTETHITTYPQAIALPGIGPRLASKIVEIVSTDRLQRLEYAKLDPQDQIIKLFNGIYGVGLVQARKFAAKGYKTLDDLVESASLTDAQKVGVEHYDDFNQRIPRSEVTAHDALVSKALKSIDESVESHIMGSYRRGAKDCGDIDIILTKPSAQISELHETLQSLITLLFEQKYLTAGLSIARHDDGTKWHGACRLEEGKPWRRIDFLVVPGEEIGAAFLYFTGNDVFNRSMRLLASRKGMRLNQRGLWKDVMRGNNREKLSEGTLVESRDEKRIFEILGVPYRPPEHRIC
ncbi:hypothetical protein TWF481_003310 [Arthrobotrys musiformis]|uniref:DNA polymerase n=1 Tax=Arthrobotrys musiformis TaxID=47236 RepID=A0AAV9VQX8_9PEZI